MWEQEKNKSQAVLVASKYLSSLGNRAESEAWVHIQDEFLLLLVLCPFPHCFPHANKVPSDVLSASFDLDKHSNAGDLHPGL